MSMFYWFIMLEKDEAVWGC